LCHYRILNKCLFRYEDASETFSRLLRLLTDDECYCSEKCIISVPSVVDIYMDSIVAHVEAVLYDEAVMLCDAVLGKCSSLMLTCSADALLQSQHEKDTSQTTVESAAVGRKRNRSVPSTDGDYVAPIIVAQAAVYKTEALLQLGRADDALLCVDKLVTLSFLLIFLYIHHVR